MGRAKCFARPFDITERYSSLVQQTKQNYVACPNTNSISLAYHYVFVKCVFLWWYFSLFGYDLNFVPTNPQTCKVCSSVGNHAPEFEVFPNIAIADCWSSYIFRSVFPTWNHISKTLLINAFNVQTSKYTVYGLGRPRRLLHTKIRWLTHVGKTLTNGGWAGL